MTAPADGVVPTDQPAQDPRYQGVDRCIREARADMLEARSRWAINPDPALAQAYNEAEARMNAALEARTRISRRTKP